jgi:Flp pilus assembly protein CpaB
MEDAIRDTLVTGVRSLRRRLLRHRRIVTALLAAGCAVAALEVWAPPAPETRDVVVAADDLSAGTRLGPDDLRVAKVAAGILPRGAAASSASFVGRTLAGPMRAGEVLTDQRIVATSLLAGFADGMVAAPLRIPDGEVASLLTVGDRVDVFAASGDVSTAAEQITSGAPVLAVPEPSEFSRDSAVVVLAVSESVAARLAQAVATTQITVVLVGPA